MLITPLKTRILLPPKDNLLEALAEALPPTLPEKCVVAITSKVVSIHEGRCVPIAQTPQEDALVLQEAEMYIPRGTLSRRKTMFTLGRGMIIPSAGIDTMHGYHILWPKNPSKSAKTIWQWLKKTYHLKNVGVIITDSHSIPFRRGTVGISLGHYGFQPLHEYTGTQGLFGNTLGTGKVANLADGLAACATLAMGEGSEQTPIALITDIANITFTTKKTTTAFEVPKKNDMYWPLFKELPWQKGKKRHTP